jgi:hypothetical protein
MERQDRRYAERVRPVIRLAAFALAGLAVTAGSAAAQSADARWLPWLGCWQADGQGAPQDLMVCVGQSRSGVEIATIADGVTASTRTLIADGQSHPLEVEGCTGWQTARFSEDSRRVFLRSELSCEGGVTRTASGIMAISSMSVWLDAQSVGLNGESMPRAIRYRPATTEAARAAGYSVPVERISAAIDARLSASADLDLEDVVEASGHVDEGALQAFLAESGQQFDLDADAIVELADTGLSGDLIDMLIAVSYPRYFAVDREGAEADMVEPEPGDREYRDRYDPFGWGGFYGWNRYNSCYGWSSSSYYCNPYRYGYGYGGYGGYYGGYGSWGYGGRPVIVVVGDNDNDSRSARAVSGRGYTRGGAPSSGTASGRTRSSGSSEPGSSVTTGASKSGSASSGGYTRSGSSSGSSSSSGRTATKKGGGGGN